MAKVYRNYTNDIPALYLKIYKAMCDCFDLYGDDRGGVDKSVMFDYIMKETKGSCNPMIIEEVLKEFEK